MSGVAEVNTTDISETKVFAPSSYPGSAVAGSVIGLGFLGVAAVGVHDFIVRFGWISGTRWTDSAASWIAESTWHNWMWPVAVVLIAVGLILLWLSVKPRRRTHETLARYDVLWTRRGDAARRCSAAMRALPGVHDATTIVRRRSAKVTVTTSTPLDENQIRAAAVEALEPVRHHPKVAVRQISRPHHAHAAEEES